jgi:rhamnosyltransferase
MMVASDCIRSREDASTGGMGKGGRVCAIVVTYQPDVDLLREVIEAIVPQVAGTVVVNNATKCAELDALTGKWAREGVVVIGSERNVGLAAGLNLGIAHARAAGFEFVLLLDQDSVASPDMVRTLLDNHEALSRRVRVGAVGAQFIDPRNGSVAPFVRIGFPFNRKLQGGHGQQVECDFLISSGSLLPLRVIDDVGAMDASLFIDNIDLDWSFRARAAGYALYGICDARMRHSIGDELLQAWWTRKGIFIHSPTRLYYLMRNRLLLYRRSHTPMLWVAQDVPRFFGKLLRMSVLVAPRRANARAMLRGAWDGLRGRSGKAAP